MTENKDRGIDSQLLGWIALIRDEQDELLCSHCHPVILAVSRTLAEVGTKENDGLSMYCLRSRYSG